MAGLIRTLTREIVREKKKRKGQLALSLAAGLLLLPLTAQASEVTKQAGNNGTIQTSADGKVYTIYADKVNGDVAFSEYSKFNLSAGEIANLKFNTAGSTGTDVSNLLNLVNDRIVVDGTVNAIRNNAVGGNLFFVSNKGMTVGATGVINAGSINIITPTTSAIDLIKDHVDDTGDNGTKLPERLKNGYYAINPSGTIQVAGKLNTVDGITMQAGTIQIQGQASLQSQASMNFTADVVNVSGVESGISPGTLTASQNENGDIVLHAIAESSSATEQERETWASEGMALIGLGIREASVTTEAGTVIQTRGTAKILAEASNEDDVWRLPDLPDSVPEAAGHIDNPLGQVSQVSASVDIGGAVTGKNVVISATATNQYNSLNDTSKLSDIADDLKSVDKFRKHYDLIKKLSDSFGVDVMYSHIITESKVEIQDTAHITATGNDITTDTNVTPALLISASSTGDNTQEALTKTEPATAYEKRTAKRAGEDNYGDAAGDRKAYQNKLTEHYGSLSVVYSGNDTSSHIIIDGSVLSQAGSLAIQASSDNAFYASSEVNTVSHNLTSTDSRIDAAIGVAVSDNHASVTVNQTGSISAKQDLTTRADALNSHDLVVRADASAGAVVATAVGVLQEDSSATVTVNGSLTAESGKLDLLTNNVLERNNLSVTNSFTGTNPALTGDVINPEEMSLLDGVNEAMKDYTKPFVSSKLSETKAAETNTSLLEKVGHFLKAGSSIGIGVETNESKINIGNNAVITAGGAVTVGSVTDITDTHMMSIGSLVNADPDATSLVNADGALLVADFDNHASVTVADGTGAVGSTPGLHARIAGGSVSVFARAEQAYGRDKGVVNDFQFLYEDLVDMIDMFENPSEQEEYQSTVEKIGKCVDDIRLTVRYMSGLDINDYIGNTVTIPTNVTDAALEILSLASSLEHLVASGKNGFRTEYDIIMETLNENVMQFVRPESYVNFIAAATSNSVGAKDPIFPKVGELSLAGAVNVNVLDINATVDIGKFTEISAVSGQAGITADASQNTVTMNGRPNIDINLTPLMETLYGNESKERKAALKNQEARLALLQEVISVRANTAGPNAIGGTLGVMEADTSGKVTIRDNAAITGYSAASDTDSILLRAGNETVLTDITFGAGQSGKIGVEGMFAWLGGNIDNGVVIGSGVTLNAKSADAVPVYDSVRMESDVNAVLTNLVGEISITNGAAIGLSAGITDYSVTNVVGSVGAVPEEAAPWTVNAAKLDAEALTDGVINTIALAGTVGISESDQQGENENTKQNTKISGIETAVDDLSKMAASASDDGVKTTIEKTENDRQDNPDPNVKSAAETLADNGTKSTKIPKFNIAGSGSVAVNIVEAETKTNLDHIAATLYGEETSERFVTAKAEDASFVGAWSGSAAATWNKNGVKLSDDKRHLANTVADDKEGINEHLDADGIIETNIDESGDITSAKPDKATTISVAFAGAVAVNDASQTVLSSIKNSQIQNASDIKNTAEKDGALVAAGLAAAFSKNTTGSESHDLSLDLAASASYNKGRGTVQALLENNTVNSGAVGSWSAITNVENLAINSDTDVAGGVDLTLSLFGKYGLGAGGSLSVSDIHNNLSAEAKGGNYYGIGSFVNHAAADLTSVATAVAASVSVGNSGVNFDLALALNNLENTSTAALSGDAAGNAITIDAAHVDVAAYDANNLNKAFDQYIADSYLDPTMKSYLQNGGSGVASKDGTDSDLGGVTVVSETVIDENGTTTATPTGYTINPVDVSDGGTDIGTAAMTISVSGKSVGANAAAAVGLLQNDFNASVTHAVIQAHGVPDTEGKTHGLDVSSNADSLLVNIAGGFAASGGAFNGAGSVGVQNTHDTVSAVVEQSNLVTPALDIEATTGSRDVNITGQVSGGKNGGGLAVTVNTLHNVTRANLLSSNVSGGEDAGVDVSVNAENDGEVYTFAVGVGAGSTAGLNGSVSVNVGSDNLEARIGTSTGENPAASVISNATGILVNTKDKSRKVSGAGSVTGAGTAAIGGGIAYNELGDYSRNEHNEVTISDKQVNRAAIENTVITTKNQADTQIAVSARDHSYLDTVSGAVGGAGSAAVDGAATVSRLGRITRAEIVSTQIDRDADPDRINFADTQVFAESKGNIFNAAIVVAGSGSAAVGAGVSVQEDSADVAASVSQSQVHAKDLSVLSVTDDTAFSIGFGGAGSMYAGLSGSFATNLLNGFTEAVIADSQVTAENNVVVAAKTDTSLDNYVGTVSFAVEGAAIGASASVNDIQNETRAKILGEETAILAKSSGSAASVADVVADSQIIHNFINTTESTIPSFSLQRSDTSYQGIAVSSSATNKLTSLVVNAGLAAIGGQVAGTVNVNLLGGKTEALVTGASLAAQNNGDVSVAAHDYANSAAYTGTVGVAGIGASIGLASNATQVSRDTSARLTGTENGPVQISAQGLTVDAQAKRGVGSVDVGVSYQATAGAAISNTDDVMLLSGSTQAELAEAVAELGGDLSVAAKQDTRLYTMGITGAASGVGAGIGLSVNVIQDDSQVAAAVKHSTISLKENGTSDIQIRANNQVRDDYELYSVGGSAIGASVNGTVSVGNSNSQVLVAVEDSTIGTQEKRAKTIGIGADHSLNLTQQSWIGNASGIGAGVGVGVNVTTVDGTVSTQLADSELYATNTVNMAATETRNATNLNGNTLFGGLGTVGINVSVMTVGKTVEDRYSAVTYTADGTETSVDSQADLANAYQEGQNAVNGNVFRADEEVDYSFGYVKNEKATQTATLGRGGSNQSAENGATIPSSVVSTTLSESTIDTEGSVNISSDAATNATMQAMSFGVGMVAASGSVAVLDTDRNAATRIENTNVAAQTISIQSNLSGQTDMDIYQGQASPAAAGNGAFGYVDNGGTSSVVVSGSNSFTADSAIQMEVDDTTQTAIDIFSVAASFDGAGGLQVSYAQTTGQNRIEMGDGNRLSAPSISVQAKNTPVLRSYVNGMNAGVLFAGNVSVATANAGKSSDDKHLSTRLTVGDGNLFDAGETGTVQFNALMNITETAVMQALDTAAGGSLLLNFNDANVYSDTAVRLGQNTYVADVLAVSGLTQTNGTMNAAGIAVGGIGAVASNSQDSTYQTTTTVEAQGTKDMTASQSGAAVETKIKNANVAASSSVTVTGDAQSYGGGVVGTGTAAYLGFTLDNTTTASLKGTWNLDESLTVSSENREAIDLGIDTLSAAIVDLSGGRLTSKVRQEADVNMKDAIVTTGKNQTYTAENSMADTLDVQASGYGGIADASGLLEEQHTYKSAIAVTNSTLHAGGFVQVGSATRGQLAADNTVKGLGALPFTSADSIHDTTYDNQVVVTDSGITTEVNHPGTSLSDSQRYLFVNGPRSNYAIDSGNGGANADPENDIVLSVSEDTVLSFTALGDNQFGAVGGTGSSLDNTLTRKGIVSVTGATTLNSGGDIRLYAGKDTQGGSTSLDAEVVSDSYNTTIVPVQFSAELNNQMKQENTVAIGSGVTGTSAGDIYLTAQSGTTKLYQDANDYNIWSGYDHADDSGITTTTGNAYPDVETVANKVTVEGNLTAGIHNTVGISITGNPTYDTEILDSIRELVQQYQNATDPGEKDELKQRIEAYEGNLINSLSYGNVQVIETKGGDWFDAGAVTPQTITLENGYYNRYTQLKEDLKNSMGTDYYASYQAEMNSLLAEMATAGFADAIATDQGVQYIVFRQRKVAGIALPDMSVSGGDVRIDTPSLTVTGSVTAKGNPSIEIESQSQLYLKVEDAVVEKEGGNVYFNDSKIDSSTADSDSLSGVANIHLESVAGPGALISITSTAAKTDPLLTADIGIYGKVIDNAGHVQIENQNYSIYVTEEGAVTGQSITIQAENGSVVQNKPDGTVTVGAEPINQWVIDNETAQRLQSVLSSEQDRLYQQDTLNRSFSNYTEYRDYVNSLTGGSDVGLPETQPGTAGQHGIVAGGAIYISGHDVNLNGLVQSGYGTYQAVLDDNALSVINQLDAAYSGTALSDATVMSNPAYCVIQSGATYDETQGQYVYTPGIYYNPSTKKLLVDSVSSSAGQVYISGNIINTGNDGSGHIIAADGASNITIDTTRSNRDLEIRNLGTSSGKGFVSITDHLQGTVFEYENGKSRSYSMTANEAQKPEMTAGDMEFKPKEKTTLEWTGSVSSTQVKTYSYEEDTYFWLIDTKTDTDIISNKPENTHIDTVNLNGQTLNNGSYLKTYADESPAGMYTSTGTGGVFGIVGSVTQGETVTGPVYKETGTDILGGVYKEVTYTWDESTPNLSSTRYVLKADNPVAIGFSSHTGGGSINVAAGGTLRMSGNVANQGGGAITLSSQQGGVLHNGGRVQGNQVTVSAFSDIDVLHAALKTDDTASVNLVTSDGNLSFVSNQGNLSVQQAQTGNVLGSAVVSAEGSLVNGAESGAAVIASRIALHSEKGAIGTNDKAFTVQAGTTPVSANPSDAGVSALASGNIFLSQANGDMRIGTMESSNGTITLTANGSFVDAADRNGTSGFDGQKRIDRWTGHNLVSVQDTADEKINSAADAKVIRENAVDTRAYQLANRNTDKVNTWSQADYDAAVAEKAASYKEVAQALAGGFAADMTDARAAYSDAVTRAKAEYDQSPQQEADKAKMQQAVTNAFAVYANARLSYFRSKGYDYTSDEAQVVSSYIDLQTGNAGWSKNSLLYAMKEDVLNAPPGEVPSYDAPNVKARNITFVNTGTTGGIGELGAPETIPVTALATEENLKKLSSAKTGELTWNYENGVLTSVTILKESPVVVSTPDTGHVVVNMSGRHVFLATVSPVTDSEGQVEEGTKLSILGDIDAGDNDVKLLAGNGVTVTRTDGENGTITANDLMIYGGLGPVGTTTAPILTDLSGFLSANSEMNIVIHQISDTHNLTIDAVAAGGSVDLSSETGIEMVPNQTGNAGSFISAGNGYIQLTAQNGGIGKAEPVRILANGTTVNLEAIKDSRIVGISEKDKALALGTVTVTDGSFSAETGKDLMASGVIQAKNDISLISAEGAITTHSTVAAEGGNLTVSAQDDIAVRAGAKAGKAMSFVTSEGSIINGTNTARLEAGTYIVLDAENGNVGENTNALRILNRSNVPIDVTGKNAWLEGIGNPTAGENTMTLQTVRVADVLNAKSEGSLIIKETTDENGDIIASVETGDITLLTEDSLTVNGAVVASSGSVTAKATNDIIANQAILAKKDISLTSTNASLIAKAVLQAEEENLTAWAKGDIAVAAVKAEKQVSLTSTEGNIGNGTDTSTYIEAGTHIVLEAENGNLGSENNALRIKNQSTAPIDGKGKNAWLKGIANPVENENTMLLHSVYVDNTLKAESEGGLTVQRATGVDGNLVNSVQAENLDLSARDSIRINGAVTSSTMSSSAGGDILLHNTVTADTRFTAKAKGKIEESGSGVLQMTNDRDLVELEAGEGVALENENNRFVRLVVHGPEKEGTPGEYSDVNGSVKVTVIGDKPWRPLAPEITEEEIPVKGLLATIASSVNGDVVLTNVEPNGTVVLYGNTVVTNPGSDGEGSVLIAADDNIVVTQGIRAAEDIAINSKKGNVFVSNSLNAQEGNVDISTENGNINVGAIVSAANGDVTMDTKTGDINVRKSLYAGGDASLISGSGTITVGNDKNGAGSVVAEGSATIRTEEGNITVNDKVVARNGTIQIVTGDGNIHVGDNGPNEETVSAKENITVETERGEIRIAGKTGSSKGNITLSAKSEAYTPGPDGMNIIVEDTGKVEAKGYVNLKAENGDIHVTDQIVAGDGLTAEIQKEGSVYFDRSAVVREDVVLSSDKGDISVGKSITSLNGDIRMTATEGNIKVNDKVTAQNGNIQISTGDGDIHIGNNGPDEKTVSAKDDITVETERGEIRIAGKTASSNGNIILAAKSGAYTPGLDGMNIIVEDTGRVEAKGYVNLKTENGDLHITDRIIAGDGLTATAKKEGGVYLDRSVVVREDVVLTADKGNIQVGGSILSGSGDVRMDTMEGNIRVEGNLNALHDVNVATGKGNISLADAQAGRKVSLEIKESGDLNADKVAAGNVVHAKVNQGDIFLNLARARAVVIDQQDNTPRSHVGTIQAEAGGKETNVALTGNYIQTDRILSKGGTSPLTVEINAPSGKELVSNVVIDNLSSDSGTVIPKLWAERGTIHVSNGYLAIRDIYTTDKIHADNKNTAFALFGRTPTSDGEPYMYWNNVTIPHRKSPVLLTDNAVYTPMINLLDASTYTWLFDRDYLDYVLASEAPWAKHTGVLLYDREHVVGGQRRNASIQEVRTE